jgi:hypothetical protein
LGTFLLLYEIDETRLWLGIGMDNSNDFRWWSRRPIGSSRYAAGMYREQTIDFKEYNADMLLSYDHNFEIFHKIS